jgi:uncharacterized protein YndB with AHSA1/START domain
MAIPNPKLETTLRLTRTFAAPREEVFRAWTDPAALKKWFAPGDDYATPNAEVDLRVGGRYRIQIQSPQGKFHTVVGVYREVKPPEKLVFTWSWAEGGMDIGETVVTVEFRDQGESTELVLTHDRFPTTEARDDHRKGWTGCLDRLSKAL